ncbi:sensor histidine kinase [Flavobacterium aquicola]|uniref:Histidine kinase n=1 Tax=Flavobacterium aquicola TaxID=1682742 RepID=A0A3E0EUG2_9FLAO|nr:histidine kinase [Flavobacterium aquicola]REH01855.1 histidine kinase [Flavobacterium aquicola]
MKKDAFKIILLALVLVVTNIVVTSTDSKYKLIKLKNGNYISKHITQVNWEYIKNRLFSGNGEEEFVYKLNPYIKNAPILVNLQDATHNDSVAVATIIKELRTIIPNRKIEYYKNFTGKDYNDFYSSNDDETLIKGFSIGELRYSTIRLNFRTAIEDYISNDIIKTILPDGSSIERTNPPRKNNKIDFTSQVWFNLKENLPYNKRIKYIKYELLRTLCYIYPYNAFNTVLIEHNSNFGIFSTPGYNPDVTEFNDSDKFLLQKLYEDDFLKQFRDYLTSSYSWRYANNFLNKDLAKMIAWVVIICIGLFVFLISFSFFQNKKFKFSFLNYFLPILLILLYVANLTEIYAYLTDLGISQIINQESIVQLYSIAIITSLIISFLLWLLEKVWLNKIKDFSFQLIYKVIFTFILFNLPITVMYIISSTNDGFLEFYLPVFIIIIVISISRGLLLYLNQYSDSLVKEKDLELSRLKQINSEAETKLLQSQINPHFLYNSLNSIASLAPIDAQKTQKMAHSLSDLFKYSINRKGKKMSTILDEIDMVNSYLEIEKIRFGDRLQFTIDVDKELKNNEIPLFLIQPLVENAVKHGISKNEGEGKIVLKISKELQEIHISVSDNGPDFPEGLISGHGLQTIFDLLRLTYGEKASLNWTNTPEKKIIITIPQTI